MKNEHLTILDLAAKVAEMVEDVYPHLPLEIRIAVVETLTASYKAEQARQVSIAALAKVFNNGR